MLLQSVYVGNMKLHSGLLLSRHFQGHQISLERHHSLISEESGSVVHTATNPARRFTWASPRDGRAVCVWGRKRNTPNSTVPRVSTASQIISSAIFPRTNQPSTPHKPSVCLRSRKLYIQRRGSRQMSLPTLRWLPLILTMFSMKCEGSLLPR